MQSAAFPPVQDLVMIGGGHTHALVLRMLAMAPMPGLRITLINPEPVAPYSGMLPGHVAGHYSRAEMMIDLVALCRAAGARLVLDRVTGIDRAGGRVHLASGRAAMGYDLASVDIGITSDLPDMPGFAAHAVPVKPLSPFLAAWEGFLARGLAAPRVAILGAGVGGVELAFACRHRLMAAGATPQIMVLGRGQPLPGVSPAARRHLMAEAARQGIILQSGAEVTAVEAGGFLLADGSRVPADLLLGVAGARPQDWLAATGLDLHDGYLTVLPSLQTSDPAIFAAGDCAHMTHAPRPKAGVFAVRQAPVLLANLRAVLSGQADQMKPFHPQADYLKLISLGDKRAMADRTGMAAGGGWIWAWKNRIDRAFMAKFADLSMKMPPVALPQGAVAGLSDLLSGQPLCGGCGAKVGPAGLSALAASLPSPSRADVLTGPGDDAAQLATAPGGPVQVITTDHLRGFCLDEGRMAEIAAVHALGDIWAMGAAPQAALAQITLPAMSERLQGRTLAEIMAAASTVFAAAGADVVGGHTTQGAELTIGFTVTGLTRAPLTKAGAQAGDRLILTKPLGSGTLLAAEMAGARPPGLIMGEAIATALETMARPLAEDAAILAPLAHAMTDVTGFGLAGHLLEMLQASGMAATLDLAQVPFLPGAEVLAGLGHASSLAPANRAGCLGRISAPKSARTDLLYDPQTGGGLLAALPPAQAEAALAALHAKGIPAALIGTVTAGQVFLTVRA